MSLTETALRHPPSLGYRLREGTLFQKGEREESAWLALAQFRFSIFKQPVVVGPELSELLLDVCCFLKRLDNVERERVCPALGDARAANRARSACAALRLRASGARPTVRMLVEEGESFRME